MTEVAEKVRVRRTKEERLKEKAEKVVPAALEGIQNVESLTKFNPSQKQRAQILAALQSQLEQLTEVFADKTEAPASGFVLQS